jgi:hypothetical protein
VFINKVLQGFNKKLCEFVVIREYIFFNLSKNDNMVSKFLRAHYKCDNFFRFFGRMT